MIGKVKMGGYGGQETIKNWKEWRRADGGARERGRESDFYRGRWWRVGNR